MRAAAYIVHRAMCEPALEWRKPKDYLSAEPLYAAPQPAMPGWIKYDPSNDVLTIHGRRYSGAMFDERGFLALAGTLLRIEEGPGEVVTLTTQPEREWVGLSEEDLNEIYRKAFGLIDSRLVGDQIKFARAIEVKCREKNA